MSNQLQHKLAHLEVEPPARLWDAITDALEDQTSAAAGKLQHFEAVPKAQLWEQIESGLDAIPEAQQHKIKAPRRIPQALRYVGAAAILFMVAATVIFLLNEDTASVKLAEQHTVTPPAKNGSDSSRETVASSEPTLKSRSVAAGRAATSNSDRQTKNSELDREDRPGQRTASSRYLTLATEQGTPVRLSKKVYPVFDCAEHSTAVKRFQCKENIEALQKMASSLASPSGDFASLMDMIKTLEENR